MPFRTPRKQKGAITSTGDGSSTPSHTSSRRFKQESGHLPATPTHQSTSGSRAQSPNLNQLEIDQARHFENDLSLTSYGADNNSESDSANINMDTEDGFKRIGQIVKRLIDTINELRKYDLEHVVNLPKLILVGDQSAGKSSLMCALAGILIPRDKGCCTRCPANIITTDSPTWSCTISLVQKYRYESPNGRAVTVKDFNRKNPFPFWIEQELVQTVFARLTDKPELANYMKWAQIALLNHNRDYKQYIPGSGTRALNGDISIEAKITPNVIKVEIFGPGLPALSFFDLPGIISNMPNPEEKYLVDVFENLAKMYIKESNTMIIFTMSMTVDPVLSRAKKVIEDMNATDRCVGVLTKPDTLADRTGNEDFENILSGKEHRLGHSWLVTKQPGPEFQSNDLEYHKKAHQAEIDFFANDKLWNSSWAGFKSKCGTERIQTVLSGLLTTSILKTIPDIERKICAHKAKILEDLRNLPDLPNQSAQLEIQRLLYNFSQEVKRLVSSEHTGTNFHGDWAMLSHDFHQLLLHIKPLIVCSHKSDALKVPIISIDSDDEETGFFDAPDTSGRKHKHQDATSDQISSQGGRKSGNLTPVAPPAFKAEVSDSGTPRPNRKGPPNPFLGTLFQEYTELGRNFASIGDIQKEMQNSSYGLPNVVDPRIHRLYCKKAVSKWKRPYIAVCHGAVTLLRSSIQTILQKNLGLYKQTFLFKKSQIAINEWIDKLCDQQLNTLEDLYQTENFAPFTLIEGAINEGKNIELAKLQQSRHKHRANCFVDKQLALGIKKIKAERFTFEYQKARQALVDQVTKEQLGADPFEVQIDVAAYVRGYYHIAANRFADSVCISLNNRLFRHVYEQVENFLENKLGTNDPELGIRNSQDLMQEDNKVAEQRRRLQREIKNLEDFEKRFNALVEDCRRSGVDASMLSNAFQVKDCHVLEDDDRSETSEYTTSGLRHQSPIEDMLNRNKRKTYDQEGEMSAKKRGKYNLHARV
ncbi:hypothetical protein DSL72_007153 [Monilinia vaccinii-corymbosi]|uniref:GED domain-containing protein n=1 Tax=Monilinia vaccinii-corymbosi TaxID=61207 RepID=A0A8A3PM52_9HELO|nr:hypothetical protein DSL72_007153 [Monilinia vaccinii-corymbosi]